LEALQWFADQGMDSMEVVTQGRNVAAQRLYQKCGFATKEVQLWYHHWFGEK
jgi:RimJ/RimL family protein N-acetyltransferase